MADEPVKICLSFIIAEIQTKTAMRYPYTLNRRARIKTRVNTNYGQYMVLLHCSWECTLGKSNHFFKSYAYPSHNLRLKKCQNISLPFTQKADLFLTNPNWKESKLSSTSEQPHKR